MQVQNKIEKDIYSFCSDNVVAKSILAYERKAHINTHFD